MNGHHQTLTGPLVGRLLYSTSSHNKTTHPRFNTSSNNFNPNEIHQPFLLTSIYTVKSQAKTTPSLREASSENAWPAEQFSADQHLEGTTQAQSTANVAHGRVRATSTIAPPIVAEV